MKAIFQTLCLRYTQDLQQIDALWHEIEHRYSEPHRHYHTLTHLEHLYALLVPFRQRMEWDSSLMALFYHDLVYDVPSHTNEKESAFIAEKRMVALRCPQKMIAKVSDMILATQHHESHHKETLLFLDADLAILGSEPEIYHEYLTKIRQEYALFTDEAYRQGRTKFITHILKKNQIFQHPMFYETYEQQAKENLTRELYNYTNKKR